MILHVSSHAPWWIRAAAEAALVLHIGGGTLGVASGSAALLVRKGAGWHRALGDAFVVSMLTMAAIGAYVSIFLHTPGNVVGGTFCFYLVLSGWATVRRKAAGVGWLDWAAAAIPPLVVAAMAVLVIQAAKAGRDSVNGTPVAVFYVMGALSALCAGLDLNVISRRGLAGAQRIARHLWRMCVALLMGAGSLFLGQQQVFPKPLQGSPVMFAPIVLIFAALFYWLWRTLGRGWGADARSGRMGLVRNGERPLANA